jgi:hypothetical protein
MSDSDAMYPCCIAGERRCPPEDVGGIGGYTDYLEATADPNHEEHEQVMMWRGPFDPEECSVEKINQELAKKFRAKPRAATPHSITLTPKRSAKANRLTKTLARSSLPAFIPPHLRASDTALAFIRPIIPQRQRIRIKADETVLLELNQRERDLIISHTFADESLADRLRAVTEPGQRPVFHFSLDELDELLGDVAAEANHVKNKVLQEQLDQLCERIEAVLSKYTDADI